MRLFYSAVLYLLTPVILIRLFISGFRNPEYWQRWEERFGFCPKLENKQPVLWVHAVSVGEVQASKPLITHLLREYPQYQILITTMTPTGALSVHQHFGSTVTHRFLPYDLPVSVKRFIVNIKPELLILMETELWPNLIHYCKSGSIPVILANARMSQISSRGYSRLLHLTRMTLSEISLITAQSQDDADRLIKLGASPEKIKITGNLKFDIKLPASVFEQAESLRRDLLAVNRPVWIAASTHDGEEKIVLNAFASVLRSHQDCLLIIAPRHPERFRLVEELCIKNGYKTVCRSKNIQCHPDVQIFVLDTMGELPVFYAASDIAFIGGSLVSSGGHNMLEPASIGIPVLYGPHVYNFSEISRLLQEDGAAWKVNDAEQLAGKVDHLLADANLRHNAGEKGRLIVETNRGSINSLMQQIREYLVRNETSQGKSI